MAATPRHILPDPYPETLGLAALTIFVPRDFRGDAEIVWHLPGKLLDEDRQRVTCNSTALLQGVFRDVRGSRPGALFDARVVALVLHAFYRARIEAAGRLEAAYQWQAYPPPH
jgi:hypothetical protein